MATQNQSPGTDREQTRGTERGEGRISSWTAPAFDEISMNAEIGGYQNEFDDQPEQGPAPRR